MDKHITGKQITAFEHQLRLEEREPATIEKYLRDIRAFTVWLGGGTLDKEAAVAWKGHLLASSYAPSTINSMLIAVNRFFRFQGWNELRVKTMRIQRRILDIPVNWMSVLMISRKRARFCILFLQRGDAPTARQPRQIFRRYGCYGRTSWASTHIRLIQSPMRNWMRWNDMVDVMLFVIQRGRLLRQVCI